MSILARLTQAEQREIRDAICPYCAVNIPDGWSSSGPPTWNLRWTHHIPDKDQAFGCQIDCEASNFRMACLKAAPPAYLASIGDVGAGEEPAS